jgi:hypothetical protein
MMMRMVVCDVVLVVLLEVLGILIISNVKRMCVLHFLRMRVM